MDSAVSWTHAFPPLVLLATSAMTQPVGRLLDTPVVHSVWLRASPILHALDALGLVIRCVAYCTVMRISPWKAIFIIGSERFPADDVYVNDASVNSSSGRACGTGTASRFAAAAKSLTATGIRLVGFGFAVVALADLAITPGGGAAHWTAAWGWMFVAAYAILEVASQVYRWELATPQYTTTDFELEEGGAALLNDTEAALPNDIDSDADSDASSSEHWSDDSMSSADTLHPGSELPRKKKRESKARTNRQARNQAASSETSNRLSPPSLSRATASGTDARDAEAATGQHRFYNDDPTAHPKLPVLRLSLHKVDRILLHVLGWPAHVVLVYWAFLDLIQPPVNQHVLAVDFANQTAPWNIVTGWRFSLLYMSLPFFLLALLLTMAVMLSVGVLAFFAFHAGSRFVVSQLPQSLVGDVDDGGTCETTTTLTAVVVGFLTCLVVGIWTSPIVGDYLFSGRFIWVYEMLTFETVVLLLYLLACFLLYVLVKHAVARTLGFAKRPHSLDISPAGVIARERARVHQDGPRAQAYLTEEGCALLTLTAVTFVTVLVWYVLRFHDSAHWLQNWRDALQYINATAAGDNSTLLANGTLENSTAASASSVPQPVVLW